MTQIFDTILTKGAQAGQIPAKTEEARQWYRNAAMEYKKLDERALMKNGNERLVNRTGIGNCYMFYYDPKFKKTLPYYDQFPLVFPFKKVDNNGFLGINLHYLPPVYRAKLMDALYDITNNKKYDESTKLKLNYDVLTSASKFKYFKPCIKHYLYEHLRSRFLYIYPKEWDICLFLPTQRFIGATKQKVWADSKKLIV